MGFLNIIRRMPLREKLPVREIVRRTGLSRIEPLSAIGSRTMARGQEVSGCGLGGAEVCHTGSAEQTGSLR